MASSEGVACWLYLGKVNPVANCVLLVILAVGEISIQFSTRVVVIDQLIPAVWMPRVSPHPILVLVLFPFNSAVFHPGCKLHGSPPVDSCSPLTCKLDTIAFCCLQPKSPNIHFSLQLNF